MTTTVPPAIRSHLAHVIEAMADLPADDHAAEIANRWRPMFRLLADHLARHQPQADDPLARLLEALAATRNAAEVWADTDPQADAALAVAEACKLVAELLA